MWNEQCKKRIAHSDKCWIHLAKEDNLRIKNSGVHGKGLFAWKRPIWKNRWISQFTGKKTTKRALDRKYGENTAQYAVCHGNQCVDSYKTTDGSARFANSARGTRLKNNSKIAIARSRPTGSHFMIALKAIKKIKPHQEILTSYGRDYWR